MKYDFHTYEKGRRCKHCSEPLADQAHKSREFCENEILEDGTVKSCHDDYHIERKQVTEAPYRAQRAFQKKMNTAISALHSTSGGDTVSVDQLDMYGIDLERALRNEPKGDNLYRFYFTGYLIEQTSIFIFKIQSHDVSTL